MIKDLLDYILIPELEIVFIIIMILSILSLIIQ